MVNIPIVFCFDSRIILGASVAIKSLIDCALESTSYDIRIFHSDLSLKNQKNLVKLTENTRHNLAFYYINPDIFKNAPHNNGSWTELVYYRLLIPEIMKEYDKVIYSDVDVLFKGDLQEVYNLDLTNYELAAVKAERNSKDIICHKYFECNKKDYIYWSGFLLFNCQKFRNENLLQKMLINAEQYNKELKFYDLDLMNITCKNIYPLDMKYCVMQSIYYYNNYKQGYDYSYLKNVYTDDEIEYSKKNTVIVHYGGKLGKPWRMKTPYFEYEKYIQTLPHSLKKYTFRDIRKKIFNKNNFEEKVFVIINSYLLGDMLLVNPLIQNIKLLYPNSKVVMLTSPKLYDVAKFQKDVGDVIIWDRHGVHKGLFGMLKFIINFPYKNVYASFPIYALDRPIILAFLLKSKYVLFNKNRNVFNIFRKTKFKIVPLNIKENVQIQHIKLLTGITQKSLSNQRMVYLPPEEWFQTKDLQDYIVLSPTSSRIEKDMPVTTVRDILKSTKYKVVLVGHGKTATSISKNLHNEYNNLFDLTNKTTITQLANVIKKSRAVIAVDTGTMHFACAINKPVVSVFYECKESGFMHDSSLYKVKNITENQTAHNILNSVEEIIKESRNDA